MLGEDRNKLFAEAIDVILAIWERDAPYDIDFPGNRFKVSTAQTQNPEIGRGGMGVKAMDGAMRGGKLVASFPVEISDQIMLATSTGQSIRVPVEQISFRSRSAGGVKVFNVGADEEVVSVARVAEQGDD
jgi:DNA gyrase/topoisomerase IV subunit A